MKKERLFLLFASSLTGEAIENIKVISFKEDSDGLFSGTVEINGHTEHIHEYHC